MNGTYTGKEFGVWRVGYDRLTPPQQKCFEALRHVPQTAVEMGVTITTARVLRRLQLAVEYIPPHLASGNLNVRKEARDEATVFVLDPRVKR